MIPEPTTPRDATGAAPVGLSGLRRLFRSPLLRVLVLTAGVYSCVLVRYARHFDHKVSGFICLGDHYLPKGWASRGLYVLPKSVGYDGQFFFYIAHDPFMHKGMAKHIDVPAYRYQRILYPLTARFAALGNPAWIPQGLLLANVGAILAGTWLVGRMLTQQGASPWYALFYAFLSGLLIPTLRDLSEPLMAAFMVGAVYNYGRQRFIAAALCVAAASLTRELAISLAAVFVVDSLLRRRVRPALLSLLAVPIVAAWQYAVFARFHRASWQDGQGNFGRPATAIVQYARDVFTATGHSSTEQMYFVVLALALALALVLAVRDICRNRNEVSLAFLGYALMPLVVSRFVWVEPWSYGRVLVPGAVFLVLAFVQTRDRLYLAPLSLHAALFAIALGWAHVF